MLNYLSTPDFNRLLTNRILLNQATEACLSRETPKTGISKSRPQGPLSCMFQFFRLVLLDASKTRRRPGFGDPRPKTWAVLCGPELGNTDITFSVFLADLFKPVSPTLLLNALCPTCFRLFSCFNTWFRWLNVSKKAC